MTAVLDEHIKTPALPLLGLLADFDGSSAAASVETANRELIFLHFRPPPAAFLSKQTPNGTERVIFNLLSNMLVKSCNPFAGALVTN